MRSISYCKCYALTEPRGSHVEALTSVRTFDDSRSTLEKDLTRRGNQILSCNRFLRWRSFELFNICSLTMIMMKTANAAWQKLSDNVGVNRSGTQELNMVFTHHIGQYRYFFSNCQIKRYNHVVAVTYLEVPWASTFKVPLKTTKNLFSC